MKVGNLLVKADDRGNFVAYRINEVYPLEVTTGARDPETSETHWATRVHLEVVQHCQEKPTHDYPMGYNFKMFMEVITPLVDQGDWILLED